MSAAAPPEMRNVKLSLFAPATVSREIDAFVLFKEPSTGRVLYSCSAKGDVAHVRGADGAEFAVLRRVTANDGSAPTYSVLLESASAPLLLVTPRTAKGRHCLLSLWDTATHAGVARISVPWLHRGCTTAAGDHSAPFLLAVTLTDAQHSGGGRRIAHGRENALFPWQSAFDPEDAFALMMDIASDETDAQLAVAGLCAVVLATVANVPRTNSGPDAGNAAEVAEAAAPAEAPAAAVTDAASSGADAAAATATALTAGQIEATTAAPAPEAAAAPTTEPAATGSSEASAPAVAGGATATPSETPTAAGDGAAPSSGCVVA